MPFHRERFELELENSGHTQAAVESKTHINKSTLSALRGGQHEQTDRRNAILLAKFFEKNEDYFIRYPDPLPSDPLYYTRLTRGYWTDNARDGEGTQTLWNSERYFKKDMKEGFDVDPDMGALIEGVAFSAQLENCLNNRFQVRAVLIGDRQLAITAVEIPSEVKGEEERKRIPHGFVGCMTVPVAVVDESNNSKHVVLLGSWLGLDRSGREAVYRYVLSDRPMSIDKLKQISERLRVYPYALAEAGHPDFAKFDVR